MKRVRALYHKYDSKTDTFYPVYPENPKPEDMFSPIEEIFAKRDAKYPYGFKYRRDQVIYNSIPADV